MKTAALVLACSNIEAMMHGVALFRFSGRKCTAVYTDGPTESAVIPAALVKAMRDYHAYQCENGPEALPPNTFALVSAIQAHRAALTV